MAPVPAKPKTYTCRPTGRTTAYAFFQQDYINSREKTEDLSRLKYSCNMKWKRMTDDEKEPWFLMEVEDKMRYDKQLKEWEERNPPQGPGRRHIRPVPRKPLKAPDAPKHPLSAFFWWGYSERPQITLENPGQGVCVISQILGQKWKDIDPDTRLKYELMAERDKARYRREKKEYLKKMKDAGTLTLA